MQRLFLPGTDWGLEWMPRVLPQVVALCEPAPEATVFTRFVPARRPGEGRGVWARYWTRWASMTLEATGPEIVGLVPELARFVPPATVVDKPVYSPWLGSDLHARLAARGCRSVLVTGGETDMCVLATVLGAADLGYRTILVSDAVCSTSDDAHDAMLGAVLRTLRPARGDRPDRGGPGPLAAAAGPLTRSHEALAGGFRRGRAVRFSATAARTSARSAGSSIASPSRKSMARRVPPSRLALNRPDGSSSAAPLAKVVFTTAL